MCLTITPSLLQLVAWLLSGARPMSEPEVCLFCCFISIEYVIFNLTTLCIIFMDISLVSHFNQLMQEHFVLPTQFL